mmetsp:Transcript_17953/g.47750  ORF Transcript_17953/g.47750 Transcript_17953/m.47750 type:complete len:368 (+) Transcript_17953:644-1747(+)
MNRGTSLYIPTGKYAMLPPALSVDIASLNVNQKVEALSFGFTLAADGTLGNCIVIPSLICVDSKHTYEEVDGILGSSIPGDSESAETTKKIKTLWAMIERHADYRERSGAITFHLPQGEPKVRDKTGSNPVVTLKVMKDTPSFAMIRESMVIAGSIAGDFCAKHKIPMPFRTQGSRQAIFSVLGDIADMSGTLSPDAYYARELERLSVLYGSETNFSPAAHHGLGLKAYIQISSPLRRFGDLIAHMQLKSFLRGNEPLSFTSQELIECFGTASHGLKSAKSVESRAQKYWQFFYLKQQGIKRYTGEYIRHLNGNLGFILLVDIGIQVVSRLPGNARLGSHYTVEIKEADARAGRVVCNVVEELSLQA